MLLDMFLADSRSASVEQGNVLGLSCVRKHGFPCLRDCHMAATILQEHETWISRQWFTFRVQFYLHMECVGVN